MEAFCLFVFCWWCFCNTNNVTSGGSQSFEVLCTGMCFLLLVLGLLDLRSSREKSTQGEIEGLLPVTKHCFVRNCLQWLLVDLLRTCHVSGSLCSSTKCDITFAQKILENEQNAEHIKYDTCWPSKSNDLHLGIRLSHPLAELILSSLQISGSNELDVPCFCWTVNGPRTLASRFAGNAGPGGSHRGGRPTMCRCGGPSSGAAGHHRVYLRRLLPVNAPVNIT